MIPSSATCGCSSSTSSSGVSGTFGCNNQNVACITVTDGIITSAQNTALSSVSGSAGCSGNYVPCLTVVNGVVTAMSNRLLAIGTGGKNQSNTIIDGVESVTWLFSQTPTLVTDSEFTFITDFIPTNARITLYQESSGYNNVFFDVAYSTDNVNFTPVGLNLQMNGAAASVATQSGSVTVGSSPAFLYWRIGYYNTSGDDRSIIIKMLTVNLWT